MRLLLQNYHKGFWESEYNQDLNKENKMQTTHQLYHCPFHVLNQQSIDPVGECCAESPRKPFKHKMLGLCWDLEINLLYRDSSHQPWRTTAISNRRQHLEASSRSWCRKARAGNRRCFKSQQQGFNSSPLLFPSGTKKNRKLKMWFHDSLLSLVALLQQGRQKWCVI